MYISVTRLLATAAAAFLLTSRSAVAQPAPAQPIVHLAEIEIDPAQLASYKAILAEEQEASIRLEPGVLMLHSVAIAGHPTQIRLLEVYSSRAAYDAHLKAPHFVKYKTSTDKMVKSLKLVATNSILLCAKSDGKAGGPANCM